MRSDMKDHSLIDIHTDDQEEEARGSLTPGLPLEKISKLWPNRFSQQTNNRDAVRPVEERPVMTSGLYPGPLHALALVVYTAEGAYDRGEILSILLLFIILPSRMPFAFSSPGRGTFF